MKSEELTTLIKMLAWRAEVSADQAAFTFHACLFNWWICVFLRIFLLTKTNSFDNIILLNTTKFNKIQQKDAF
jgi:hypothetical protein